jgi:hypothetical protein
MCFEEMMKTLVRIRFREVNMMFHVKSDISVMEALHAHTPSVLSSQNGISS